MPAKRQKPIKTRYQVLAEQLAERGIDIEAAKRAVQAFEVELPSWVFGTFGGGRFAGYVPLAPAPDIRAKIRDAAFVHKLTGATPRVAIHVGWDKPQGVEFDKIKAAQFADLPDYARQQGINLGSINPTLFLAGTHYGSLSSTCKDARKTLIRHCITCCEIAEKYSEGLVCYWLPDGSNYPGQVDLWEQERLVRDALKEVYDAASKRIIHLIEYKLFEPGTYSTVISDAGVALDIVRSLGERAGVLVDMGHHAWGVNVPQIVARLLGLGVRSGFHFNARYAADDDHSSEPNIQLYAVFCELVNGKVVANADARRNWAYMIDQAAPLENRFHAVLHTVDSLQVSLAKALVLDRKRLAAMQAEHNIIGANRVFLDAFLTDVRPIVQMARLERDLPPDPAEAYDASGYQRQIETERA